MEKFCRLLGAMIEDEHKAYSEEYPKLLDALGSGNEPYRMVIETIKADEHKHHDFLKAMHELVCTEKP